jgi:hypothetical protein
MSFWQKVKTDVEKGVTGGLAFMRGTAEKLTEEGKRWYRAFELKNAVHRQVSDLGGLVYELSRKSKNVMADPKVKAAIEKIRKMEEKILHLERAPKKKALSGKKKVAKKVAAKKKSAKKKTTAKKKTAKATTKKAS